MQKTLSELDVLYNLINLEKDKYKEAIQNNQKFEDVKVIYLKMKELEKAADKLMKRANRLHKAG